MANWLDFKALSDDYAKYHSHPMNRRCHTIGIPLIVFCIVRWTLTPWGFPWIAPALILYAVWSPALAAVMALIIAAMTWAAPSAGFWTVIALFAVGWIFQLVGHEVFEKRSPAFARNLIHLLVGPMWILQEYSPKR